MIVALPACTRNELRKDIDNRITIKTSMNNELTLECCKMHNNYIIAKSKVFCDFPGKVLFLYLSI